MSTQGIEPSPSRHLPPVVVRRIRGARLKRGVDVVVSGTLVVALSPLLALLAVLVRVDSSGPAIYRGERLGLGRRPFTVYKFRSMHVDASAELHRDYVVGLLRDGELPGAHEDEVAFKIGDDPRVTRVGRWMRRTTLDELPQLLNVLRGEMSLVGPRPEVPYALAGYEDWHHERFGVKPGLTGLWQVSGRGELPPRQMLALDVEYARNAGPSIDARLMARTVPALLRRTGAA